MTPQDLLAAIEGRAEGLYLVYQPVVALASRKVLGVEALARWHHPERGPIAAPTFVHLAEENGIIGALTRWVAREAVRQAAEWARGGDAIRVAINVSTSNLAESELPDMLSGLCIEAALSPARLTLEVTETVAATSGVVVLDTLTRLRMKGFNVMIDDFGTGYSSLVQLRDLPFSGLKIDRSFVVNAATKREDRVIVEATIDLAHKLGLLVVAEGIETLDALALLDKSGCDMGQGYLFARPMAGADLPAWRRAFEGRAALTLPA
jgi:EAL domain-containing protein (putative c-di-GMP-specific phosphodiesterase class I)